VRWQSCMLRMLQIGASAPLQSVPTLTTCSGTAIAAKCCRASPAAIALSTRRRRGTPQPSSHWERCGGTTCIVAIAGQSDLDRLT
jgi:hypothetical protein